jgi:hypothetical protein
VWCAAATPGGHRVRNHGWISVPRPPPCARIHGCGSADAGATADQLLADARAGCLRDAVPASKQELVARIAARIGLSQAEVAESLWRNGRGTRPVPRAHADDAMIALAATIPGRREHTVFLARHDAPPNDAHTLHQLTTQLGVSIERISQLDASALHKFTTALR